MNKEIVIIGGGFAGVNLAKQLKDKKEFYITLVDKNNYNFFPPLLYQVATGMLDVSSISTPFRTIFKGVDNISFRMGELQKVEPESNKVQLSTGELKYDGLVIATGTKSNFFGMENIEKNAVPMKTINDAVKMRNYLLQKTEEATYTDDPVKKAKLRNVVISGAGPTGVEVAGMLAEMRNNMLEKIYPELANQELNIFLVDAAPTVLPPMRERSQKYTHEALEEMGVKVKLEKMVEDYKDDTVYFRDGDTIETETLIWTAGVTGRMFEGIPEESYGRGNRLLVNEFNKVKGTENIYAIGDACLQKTDENFPEGHPQLANVAMQHGEHLANNFLAMSNGESLEPFHYFDKGSMAIIGRSKATADLTNPSKTVTGWLAWAMWLFVHLFQLINYRNRVKTMWNWTTAYFIQDQSLGMIIRPSERVGTATIEKEMARDEEWLVELGSRHIELQINGIPTRGSDYG
ncbi:NAD(P)/FAD-dependent oxidoreductase [Aliifodinibius sp. S!AR15-10]|uniref:NAD(P)/FAD-dependent oxidoreductase n=1 Tax=Aliifodinibius sp. S!AR15-10 TaxID=2950437 RepID=UPI002861EF89|nr:NAD(P)/FAD-dependent oxidoreductase [Aliifodinibius sp. S!AR15-10]MDR8390019.1 NAD(P)/FAD-dependent oxidoreductase [Aliifodinibius sp. S!AR15-10]